MKKALIGLLIGLMMAAPVSAQTDKEILFRSVPWGTSFSDVKQIS